MTRHVPRFVHEARVERRLAAAGLTRGKFHRQAEPFQDADHGHAGVREKLVDQAGDEKLHAVGPRARAKTAVTGARFRCCSHDGHYNTRPCKMTHEPCADPPRHCRKMDYNGTKRRAMR